jgi:hypothetical protein
MSFSSFLVSTWSMTDSVSHPLPDLLDVPRVVLYAVPVLVAAVLLLLWRRWHARMELEPVEPPSPPPGDRDGYAGSRQREATLTAS